MKFTLTWLKQYLDTTATLDDITNKLTAIGLEVEGVEDPSKTLAGFVVGHVISADKHPDADKLQCLVVDTGKEKLKVVCGAPNARAGMRGVFAPAGSYIPGLDVTLKKTAIRGQESNGMMCSERELCLSEEHNGIIDLALDLPAGVPAAPALGLDDIFIEINLTPNRGDCAGVYGIARDLAASGLGKLKPVSASPIKSTIKTTIGVTIADEKACPLFLGRLIKGVTNGASPADAQKMMTMAGINRISSLVDITNLMCIGMNRPLHVFDADKLKGDIHVRLSKKGETLAALNDKTYELEDGMIVVCDDGGKRVIGLGGVIGGVETAVDANTKNVYIECAYFDPVLIAKTGQKLQIDSDARYRFERGIDPAFCAQGMEIATAMVLERCGGEAGDVVQAGKAPDNTRTISYAPERLKLLGGMDMDEARQKEILTALGFDITASGKSWQVKIPSWRHDVEGSADIVEEVLRIAGYDTIEPITVRPAANDKRAPMNDLSQRAIRARQLLATRGMYETVTWSFLAEDRADLFGALEHQNKAALTLTNPISIDLSVMRPSILPNLIDAAARNADRGISDAALFEIGTVYRSSDAAGQIMTATGLRTQMAKPRHWSGAPRAVDVFDVKADVMAVLEACGVKTENLQITRDAATHYHPGRSAQLRQGTQVVAAFGEIHPAVLATLKREEAMAGFEVFLANLPPVKRKGTAKALLRPSPFQPVSRDFAFMAAANLASDVLTRAIKAVDKQLITDVSVFDVYQGKGVPEGQKSVALSVTVQPVDKTLTDAEITALSDKIVAAAQKAGAELRKL